MGIKKAVNHEERRQYLKRFRHVSISRNTHNKLVRYCSKNHIKIGSFVNSLIEQELQKFSDCNTQ